MPMFEVPFRRSEEWNEFRHRADEKLSVIAPKCRSRQDDRLRCSALHPLPELAVQLSEQIHLGRLRRFDVECGGSCWSGGGFDWFGISIQKFF